VHEMDSFISGQERVAGSSDSKHSVPVNNGEFLDRMTLLHDVRW
jgi:hypothetical protein